MLYKYVSLAVGQAILSTGSIGFTFPEFFNDPLDVPRAPRPWRERPESITDLNTDLEQMRIDAEWRNTTGILALTRTPSNALMWAHYADQHKGMVIGIDPNIAGLTDVQRCLIPTQYGNVLYVSRRSEEPFVSMPEKPMTPGQTFAFSVEHFEHLQRLFLHKALYWAYEEEVRVLKCLSGIEGPGGENRSGTFSRQSEHEAFRYHLPEKSIREVYFGLRMDLWTGEALFRQLSDTGIDVFETNMSISALTVGHSAYSPLDPSHSAFDGI